MSQVKPILEPSHPQVVAGVLERLRTMPMEELEFLLHKDTPTEDRLVPFVADTLPMAEKATKALQDYTRAKSYDEAMAQLQLAQEAIAETQRCLEQQRRSDWADNSGTEK
jgi:hypothetical protein